MKRAVRVGIVLLMAVASSPALGQERQDQFFDSDGVRIRYIEQGAGEPVVLVHGYMGTAEASWVVTGIFQTLAKDHHVIALDCRGHGKSDKPHDPHQYGPEMALDVVRLLDHLKIQKAHIVGYSMGGTITAKLLTMKPERFLSATLGVAGGLLDPTEQEIKFFEQVADELEKGSIRTLMSMLSPKDQPLLSEDQTKLLMAAVLATQDVTALVAVARSTPDLAITEAEARAIETPTIAIVGTADPLIEGVNKLKKARPTLKVVAIEKANHATAIKRPEFLAALQEVLKANPVAK